MRMAERVGIRQARSGDQEAIRDFLTGLSLRTRYQRFFSGAPPMNGRVLAAMAGGGDGVDAVVATQNGTVVGHAMAVHTAGPAGARTAQIGVVVTDACQGRGVGSALIRTLTDRARARGATSVVMDVLADNRQVLTMISHHWPAAQYDPSGIYVTVQARLPRSAANGGPRKAGERTEC